MRCDNTYHGSLLICEREVHSFDEPCTACEPLSAQSRVDNGKPLRRTWTGRFPKKPVDPVYARQRYVQQALMMKPGHMTVAELNELLALGRNAA